MKRGMWSQSAVAIFSCITFLPTVYLADQFMNKGNNFNLQSSFSLSQSQSGPICAECLEKNTLNVVRVLPVGQQEHQQNQQSRQGFASLISSQDQDEQRDIQPSNPQILTTTIFETFPTVFNGVTITGKRTRISVYYATQAQALQTAGQQVNQGFNNQIPSRMISPNQYQSNPGQLQRYYSSNQNQQQQPRPQQRAYLNGEDRQPQQQLGTASSQQTANQQDDFLSSANAETGFSSQSRDISSNSGQMNSANFNGLSSRQPVNDQSLPNGITQGSLSSSSNNQFNGGLTGFQPVLMSPASFNGQQGQTLSGMSSQQTNGHNSSAQVDMQHVTAAPFQEILPQPSQDFTALSASATSRPNSNLVGGRYQSLSTYSIQGTDGFLTLGQVTFFGPAADSITTAKDLRTVSPTMVQPINSFLSSTSRIEAFFVPISNVRVRGERTRYSYFYAMPGQNNNNAVQPETSSFFASPIQQSTPSLPVFPPQADQNQQQREVSVSGVTGSQSVFPSGVPTNNIDLLAGSNLGQGQMTNSGSGQTTASGLTSANDQSQMTFNSGSGQVVTPLENSAQSNSDSGSGSGSGMLNIISYPNRPAALSSSSSSSSSQIQSQFISSNQQTNAISSTDAPRQMAINHGGQRMNSNQQSFTAADALSSSTSHGRSDSFDYVSEANPTYNSQQGAIFAGPAPSYRTKDEDAQGRFNNNRSFSSNKDANQRFNVGDAVSNGASPRIQDSNALSSSQGNNNTIIRFRALTNNNAAAISTNTFPPQTFSTSSNTANRGAVVQVGSSASSSSGFSNTLQSGWRFADNAASSGQSSNISLSADQF